MYIHKRAVLVTDLCWVINDKQKFKLPVRRLADKPTEDV